MNLSELSKIVEYPTQLGKLFKKYNCDKCLKHQYDRVYGPVLEELKGKKINILEIGIFNGYSTEAFHEYLPHANLYGIDIFQRVDPKNLECYRKDRTHYIAYSSTKPKIIDLVKMYWGDIKFDIIIDDGKHTPKANMQTFENLSRYLKSGGIYFIEDIFPIDLYSPSEFKSLSKVYNLKEHQPKMHGEFLNVLRESGMEITKFDLRSTSGGADSYIIGLEKPSDIKEENYLIDETKIYGVDFMMGKWKKIPNNEWLLNLDNHRIKTKPIGNWDCRGPWYSDDGEDGVLNYIFSYINDQYKFAVDIGSAHGYGGSNVRHLVDNNNWNSIELDFGRWNRDGKPAQHPNVRRETITHGNICNILQKYKTPKLFDLLSLDLDSIDYHVLSSLLRGGYRPSVSIIEFNPIFNHNEPYIKKLDNEFRKDSTSNYGASLRAFQLLFFKYEYTLVHVFGNENIECNNAIFMRNDYIIDNTKVKTIEKLHPHSWVESWKNNDKMDAGYFSDSDNSNIKDSRTISGAKYNLINNSFIKLKTPELFDLIKSGGI